MVWTLPFASKILNAAADQETPVVTDQSLDNNEIGVFCPDCRHETKKNIGWVKTHTQLECRNCGAIIDIESRNFRIADSTRTKR
jgi:ribosomal protein S27E